MASAGAESASWGFEARTHYELAEEILAFLRAGSGRRLRQARAHDPADPREVARLAAENARYIELRANVHRLSPAEIEATIAHFGPLARSAAGAIIAS